MIYDVRSPYFKKFLVRGSSKPSPNENMKAMLSQLLHNLQVVSSGPPAPTSA